MDPLGVGNPDLDGYVHVRGGVSLHYELYKPPVGSSSASSSSPLLMVMGAFATKLHFSEMARHLADASGHDVCIYDHRGVGRSSAPRLEAQTAAQLASDAVAVADTLWGASQPMHVFGASMGGMVAQELALLLIPQERLLSLSLSITCRGMKPLYGLLSPIFVPKVIKHFFELWYWDSKPNLVRRLMRLLLTRQLRESLHPCGQTYGQVYYRAWLERFEELWTFNNHAAGACHAHVVLHHHLTDQQIAVIRNCGVPLMCQVSTHDNLIPAAMQFELADKLRARTITIPTGHMGMLPWRERFYGALLEQLAMGEAVRGVNQAERARNSSKAAALAVPGTASLMAAFSKPLMTMFSGASSGGGSSAAQHIPSAPFTTQFSHDAPSSVTATPEPSLDLAEAEGEQAGDVTDLSVVVDDEPDMLAGGQKNATSALAYIRGLLHAAPA